MDAGARRRRPGHPGLDLAALSRILVVNAGSTSLKLSTVDADGASTRYEALEDVPGDVAAVGHRVVHGGRHFGAAALLTPEAIEQIRELSSLAPLHTEPALRGIAGARGAFPDVPHVAVFDSAFHATMPAEASTYAVPHRWREEWGVRRYGFHGLAVASVAERVQARRLVVCHLGGGCSVTAVLDGRSVDTTMGFSPLEGVPMATRSGSVDPSAFLYLLRVQGLTPDELDEALEHESGLKALGGLDEPLGFGVYTYRIAQAVAAMTAALGGLDALAFSGGVGENREDVRRAIVERLRHLGEFRVEVVEAREDVVVARTVRELLDPSFSAAKPVLSTDAARRARVDPVSMAARPRKIMVGYDGSDASRRALDAAADLVGYGSTLSVVTVKNGDIGSWVTGDAHARLLGRHVQARYHETTGEPAEQLVEKATELGADLVVVAGSVSSRVVRGAHCDVLVVR